LRIVESRWADATIWTGILIGLLGRTLLACLYSGSSQDIFSDLRTIFFLRFQPWLLYSVLVLVLEMYFPVVSFVGFALVLLCSPFRFQRFNPQIFSRVSEKELLCFDKESIRPTRYVRVPFNPSILREYKYLASFL